MRIEPTKTNARTGAGVLQGEVLVGELGAVDGLAASAVVVGEVTALAHEVLDDTAKRDERESAGEVVQTQRRLEIVFHNEKDLAKGSATNTSTTTSNIKKKTKKNTPVERGALEAKALLAGAESAEVLCKELSIEYKRKGLCDGAGRRDIR
jgi:hypothetical protein